MAGHTFLGCVLKIDFELHVQTPRLFCIRWLNQGYCLAKQQLVWSLVFAVLEKFRLDMLCKVDFRQILKRRYLLPEHLGVIENERFRG